MKKIDIFMTLEKYNLNKEEYIILSGAVLVIFGVKNETHDIDLAVSDQLYKYLEANYNCIVDQYDDEYKANVYLIDNVINFGPKYFNEIEYEYYDGYKIQTLESIIKLKKDLGREKDFDDLKKIAVYLKNIYKRWN